MIRNTLSPRATVKSPRQTIDSSINLPSRFPSIKERKSTNLTQKVTNIPFEFKNDDQGKNSKSKAINLFDIQSPVNERKVAIVKNTLENRNVFSPQMRKVPKEDSPNCFKNKINICKSELGLQIDFLKEKNLGSKIQKVAEKVKNMTQSIEFDRLKVPENQSITKSGSVEVILSKNPSVSNCSYLSDKSDVSPENASFKLNESSQSIEGKKEKLKSTIFHSQVVEDDIEKAKQEKKTFQVTNSELSAENFKLKQEKEEILTENLNLKQEKERLLEELEKNSAQVQDFKTVLEKQIKLLHEEIKVKDEDYENLKDQLKKSEFNRKKFAEALKDAEAELNLSKKKNSQLLSSFEALERKNKENLEIIHEEKQKVYIIDELKQEIEQLKYEMILLKDQNFVLKNESLIAKESLETVRKNFDNLRICSRDKETEFQRVIEDMMEQVNSEKARTALQAAETAKLKKTLTWKDSDTFNNFSREEISRFQQKIIQLDKENGDLVSEIEKLQKNIDYFKFLIKNKEEVLQKLESENLSLKSSNESILLSYSQESLQNLLKSLNSWMTCQKCKESISVYLISPCFHLVCSKCEPVSSICPACEGFLTHQSLFSDFNKLREVISLLQSLQVSL